MSGDIAILWRDTKGDIGIGRDDIEVDDGLETAVLLSLFTDRRADEGDILPDGQIDRRGWWGDSFPEVEGDRIGSRLWLLSREKQQQAVLDRAREYAMEALQWLIDDRVASRVEVTAEVVRTGVLGLTVVIERPQTDTVEYRFNYTWAAQEARRP